jgi:hypothetical protein
MPVLVHAGQLHITHLSIAAEEFAELLAAHYTQFPDTAAIERDAEQLIAGEFESHSTLEFVGRVMNWGGGDRNVSRVVAQQERVTTLVAAAYADALERGPAGALATLKPIKRLGIAFGSKLLRFLLPSSAVILDSVIRENLGYPNSQRGYLAFLAECHELLDHVRDQPYPLQAGGTWRICDIEAAIYARLQGY